jgi:predicted nucleic acid-binding protein
MNAHRETLICDTSFVAHYSRRKESPDRYTHWGEDDLARIAEALLTISVVTLAELRAGYVGAGWGSRRVAEAEREVGDFVPVLIDDPHLNEWARLWVAACNRGVALSDNDLWVGRRRALAVVHS